jgi:hypothetical protein
MGLAGFSILFGFAGLKGFRRLAGFIGLLGFSKLLGFIGLLGFSMLFGFIGLLGFCKLLGFMGLLGFHRFDGFPPREYCLDAFEPRMSLDKIFTKITRTMIPTATTISLAIVPSESASCHSK